MATIRRRSWTSGGETRTAWVADYTDQAGARRLKTFATRKAADTWLVEARHQVASGTHLPETTAPTLAQAAARWLASAEARGLERTTLMGYREHVGHVLPRLGALKLSRLSEEDVHRFRITSSQRCRGQWRPRYGQPAVDSPPGTASDGCALGPATRAP
jgi:integrase